MNFFKKNKYSFLQSFLKYSFVLVISFSFIFTLVLAEEDPIAGTFSDTSAGTFSNTTKISIDNPIRCDDIPCFIDEIIGIVLVVGIPLITLAIIYSGFLFVSAQGNTEKLKTAKQALLYTVIGAALLLGAFVLSEAIQKTVNDIG
jgi:hypothetical protein